MRLLAPESRPIHPISYRRSGRRASARAFRPCRLRAGAAPAAAGAGAGCGGPRLPGPNARTSASRRRSTGAGIAPGGRAGGRPRGPRRPGEVRPAGSPTACRGRAFAAPGRAGPGGRGPRGEGDVGARPPAMEGRRRGRRAGPAFGGGGGAAARPGARACPCAAPWNKYQNLPFKYGTLISCRLAPPPMNSTRGRSDILRPVIIHDVCLPSGSPAYIMTSAEPAACHVCGRGLEDGFSLSGRSGANGRTILLCSMHAR